MVSNAKRLKLLKLVILTANVGTCEIPSVVAAFMHADSPWHMMCVPAHSDVKYFAVVQALHVAVKLLLFRETRTWLSFLGLGFTSLIYVVCYTGLAGMAGVVLLTPPVPADDTPCMAVSGVVCACTPQSRPMGRPVSWWMEGQT